MKASQYAKYIPAMIGLAVGLVAMAAFSLGVPILRLDLAASDWLFLREGGPRLGARTTRADIVLLLFDAPSARELGRLPIYEEDLKVYRTLLGEGAKVVADVRMLAAVDEKGRPSELKPLLDGMVATGAGSRLLRDIWVTGTWLEERPELYAQHIGHNVLNLHASADFSLHARLYPLLVFRSDGLHETLPLLVARAALDLPPSTRVLEEAKFRGITAAWKRLFPPGKPFPASLQPTGETAQPYPLGERLIPWQLSPSTTPLLPPAAMWVSYAAPPSSYARLSYVNVVRGRMPARAVAGKIVVIGYDPLIDPSSDTSLIPSSTVRASAAEVVASAVQTILESRFTTLAPPPVTLGVVLVCGLLGAWAVGLLRPFPAAASLAALLLAYLAATTASFRAGVLTDLVIAPGALLLAAATTITYRYLHEYQERRRVIDLFGRYVPRAVVNDLVQQSRAKTLSVGGIKRDITVMFADIRGFTSFSEKLPPEEVINHLNAFLRVMVECVFRHEGTVDKYIGDAILVLFNAPLDQPNHAIRAIRTAWDMQQALAGDPTGLAFGIGVHSGEAVVGTVGTPDRMEYTAIGSTVNIASRLCGVAGRGQIVISDETRARLGNAFALQALPPVKVKGIEHELQTYLVTGAGPTEPQDLDGRF